MSTANESLAKFKEKTDALINSKYLFAEREISEVLKVIAGSRMLYELFEYVTDGFDYETFKSFCFSKGNPVKLPGRDEDLLALCFLLLVEVDGGKISLDEFCDEYFPSGGSAQGKFAAFVLAVVIPFELATEKAVKKLIEEQNAEKSEPEKEPTEKSAKFEPENTTAGEEATENPEKQVENKVKQSGYDFIRNARANVKARADRKRADAAEEATYILDSLERALKKRDFETVTIAFVALKYFAAAERKFKINVEEVSDGIASVMNGK